MKPIVNLLFQAKILKDIPRSGYHFLGAGSESIAEHTFMTAFIAFVMAQMDANVDAQRLINMALVHDLAESRIGDLNTVQKEYVTANETKAVSDTSQHLPFGTLLDDLVREFNEGQTLEAKLARDADQLAFVLDLKALADVGYVPPKNWLQPVIQRLQTDVAKKLAETVLTTQWDEWWLKKYLDTSNANH
jgi:putative hydrolase of HD superfamily